jgi:hypothetical protein
MHLVTYGHSEDLRAQFMKKRKQEPNVAITPLLAAVLSKNLKVDKGHQDCMNEYLD